MFWQSPQQRRKGVHKHPCFRCGDLREPFRSRWILRLADKLFTRGDGCSVVSPLAGFQRLSRVHRGPLAANRRALCRLLWHQWSPTWHFTEETYNLTAPSFDNPDFVDVVIHSYRHRVGNAPGEERFKAVEAQLAKRPKIEVQATLLYGGDDFLGGAAPEVRKGRKRVISKNCLSNSSINTARPAQCSSERLPKTHRRVLLWLSAVHRTLTGPSDSRRAHAGRLRDFRQESPCARSSRA
jgi:hypothetical protein